MGNTPYGAAVSALGDRVFVTNQHADTVSVIDAAANRVIATLPVGGYPEGIAVHGGRVYVVNWMDDNLLVLDAASGRTVATVDTGRNSRGFGQFIGSP